MPARQNQDIIRVVPPTYHGFLDYHVVSMFAKNHRLHQLAYDLEDCGAVYIGDLVKWTRDDVFAVARTEKRVNAVEEILAKMRLTFDMRTPGWVSRRYKPVRRY